MGKTFRVVDEFEFPESFGFKASAGRVPVKGYDRAKPTPSQAAQAVGRAVSNPVVNRSRDIDSAVDKAVDGYCRGGMAKRYAKGGHVESKEKAADIKQDKAMMAGMVHKHESGMHPGKPKTKFANGGPVGRPVPKPMPVQARPQPAMRARRAPPFAAAPMVSAMKKGGPVIHPKKVEKVMAEFKSGDLKSSSGAPVTGRKQAIAIALSEARRGKK